MYRLIALPLFGALMLTVCGSAKAQGPVLGQPYLVPPGYEVYGPGTLINYAGFNYVLQGDGTMYVSQPAYNPPPPPVQYDIPLYQYDTTQAIGMTNWSQPSQPSGVGWGYSPNQMGFYQTQPVNYQNHNLYYVQGNMGGHSYQGLFTNPPHHHGH